MYILRPDERTTPVMLYSLNSVVRGEVVVKQNVQRVNIWLRTDGAPRYMHVLKPQVLLGGGGSMKSLSHSEIFFPTSEVIGFHTLPPTDEPLDYDPNEANRMMTEMELLVGIFLMKGKIRISTQTELATSLEVARVSWMSVYDVSITNPYLPQMPAIHVPMVLIPVEGSIPRRLRRNKKMKDSCDLADRYPVRLRRGFSLIPIALPLELPEIQPHLPA
jgi:hypothetical protein